MQLKEKFSTKRLENVAFADQQEDHLGNSLEKSKAVSPPSLQLSAGKPVQKKDKQNSRSQEDVEEKEKEKQQEAELEFLVEQQVQQDIEEDAAEEALEQELYEEALAEELLAQQMEEEAMMSEQGEGAPEGGGTAQLKSNRSKAQLEEKFTNRKKSSFKLSSSNEIRLPEPVQRKMESSFQRDFSSVKIHNNSEQAKNYGARAFTLGDSVHFAPGQFEPSSQKGQELIGHELAHVVQQQNGIVAPNNRIGNTAVNDEPRLENEADNAAKMAVSGENIMQQKSEEGSSGNHSEIIQGKFSKDIGGLSKDDSGWGQEMLEGAIYGDLIDDEDKNWKNIIGQIVVGFIPYVGQAADIRDIGVAINNMGNGGWKEGGNWANLGLSVIGVIPGLGDAVKGLKHVPWGKVGKFFAKNAGKLWDGVKGVGKYLGGKAKGAWKGIKGAGKWLGGKAKGAWEGIKGAGKWLGGKAKGAWDGIKGAGSWLGGKAKGAWEGIKGAGSWLGGKAKGAWEGIKGAGSWLGGKAKGAWEGIKGAGNWLGGKAKGAWEGIKGAGNWLGGKAKGLLDHAGEGIKGAAGWLGGKAKSVLGGIKSGAGWLGDRARGVFGGVKKGIGTIGKGIKSGMGWLGGKARGVFGGVKKGIGTIGKGIKSGLGWLGGKAKGVFGGIKKGIGSIGKGIKSGIGWLGGKAKGVFGGVKKGIGAIGKGIKSGISWVGGKAKGALDGVKKGAKYLGAKAKGAANWAGKKIGNAYNKYIQSPIGKVDQWIKDKYVSNFKPLVGYTKEKIKEKADDIKNAFKSGVSSVKSGLKKLKFW